MLNRNGPETLTTRRRTRCVPPSGAERIHDEAGESLPLAWSGRCGGAHPGACGAPARPEPWEPVGNTTTTDSRSQRNREGRRGGQLLTRARGSSCKSACPRFVLPDAPIPDGHTIRRASRRGIARHRSISCRLPTPSRVCARGCARSLRRAATSQATTRPPGKLTSAKLGERTPALTISAHPRTTVTL
jgi:hypothetical protein